MQYILIALEMNIFKKKKNYSKQKYNNKYLQNTSMQFDNVWILWYWI